MLLKRLLTVAAAIFVSSNAQQAGLSNNISAMKSLMQAVEQGVEDQKKLEKAEWTIVGLTKNLDLSMKNLATQKQEIKEKTTEMKTFRQKFFNAESALK